MSVCELQCANNAVHGRCGVEELWLLETAACESSSEWNSWCMRNEEVCGAQGVWGFWELQCI